MITNIKRYIYLLILEISKIILKFSLIFKLPIFAAFGIILSIRKLKSSHNKSKKTVLVLEKSHGIDDVKQIVYFKKDKGINFFLLSRIHLRIIFDFFEKKSYENYLDFINRLFYILKKLLKINLIISFNLRYPSEKIFQRLDKKLNIKFIVLQKECLFNKNVILNLKKYFVKQGKFNGDHITTYNHQFKDMLTSINFVGKDKITVVGMNRADRYFKTQNNYQNHILYFLIRPKTGIIEDITSFTWNELANRSLKIVLDSAEKNLDINFFFKTKILNDEETLSQQEQIKNRLLKNCNLITGGDSYSYIKDAKLIVAFNSTAVLEGLACKKKILVPYFENYSSELEKYIIDTLESPNIYHARSDDDMIKYLDYSLNNKDKLTYKNNEIDKKLLKTHIGNSDGKSTIRLLNVIKNNLS